MKTIKVILSVLILATIMTSCLCDVTVFDLIPEISGDLCDKTNLESDYKDLLWDTALDSSLAYHSIESPPMIFEDQIIVVSSKTSKLKFKLFDRSTGYFLRDTLPELGPIYVDHIRSFKNLILILTGSRLIAINTNDFSVHWEINLHGYGLDHNRYVITNDDKIIIPSIASSNEGKKIILNTYYLSNGFIISSKSILTANMSQSTGMRFSSLDYDYNQNKLLIGYSGLLANDHRYVEVINYNLSNSSIHWKWNKVNDFSKHSVMKITKPYVSIVSDSLYFLDINSGIEINSQVINYPDYGVLRGPIIRHDNDMVYLKIYGVGVSAINLSDFSTLWSSSNFDLITLNDQTLDENHHLNTDSRLRIVDLQQGTEEVLEEMPYICSSMDEKFTFDTNDGIVYFTDSKRLYAYPLE